MSAKDKESVQEVLQDDSGPPPYTVKKSDLAPREDRDIQAATHLATTCCPYRAFPLKIKAYCSWRHWKRFSICDATSNEHIFLVEVHTGYSGKPPLGTRPGYILHNGTKLTDPILAATGDESQMSGRIYALNNSSVVILPSLEPGPSYVRMDTTRMRGAPSKEYGTTFGFSIEVGKEQHREKLEWRKITEGISGHEKSGSFKLVRLCPGASRSTQPLGANSGSSGDAKGQDFCTSSSQPNSSCETIAILELVPPWSSFTKLFTLEMLGSAQSGMLGDRCMLMIIMTAMRLSALRLKGKTTKTFNKTAEKLHS